jgi:hypothetical protein
MGTRRFNKNAKLLRSLLGLSQEETTLGHVSTKNKRNSWKSKVGSGEVHKYTCESEYAAHSKKPENFI